MEPEVQEPLLDRAPTPVNGGHIADINRLEIILNDTERPWRKRMKEAFILESKLLWRLAAPAVVVYMVNYAMSMATQIFSGHLGNLQLAAASLGNTGIQVFAYGLMVHKEANGWRGKPFPIYEKFYIIFGKDRANGRRAEGLGEFMVNVEDETMNLGLDEMEMETSVNQATCNQTVTPTFERSSRKRFKSGDSLVSGLKDIAATFVNLVDKTCERMDKVVEKLGHAKDFSNDSKRVSKELEDMGFSSMERINAAMIIVDKPQNVELFWSFNREDKEAYVRLLLARESRSYM